MLHDWDEEPEQLLPPHEGDGLVQVLVCVPPPQEALQALQALQPPFTGVQAAWQVPLTQFPEVHSSLQLQFAPFEQLISDWHPVGLLLQEAQTPLKMASPEAQFS